MAVGSRAGRPPTPGAVLGSWLEEWEGIHASGGLFTLTVHPWISGRVQRIRLLCKLLEHVATRSDVWVTTALELARHHEKSTNAGTTGKRSRRSTRLLRETCVRRLEH